LADNEAGVAVSPLQTESSHGFSLLDTPELPEVPTEDPKRFIEQLVKNMELVNRSGQTEMRIQLKPEFLGKMTVALTLEEGVLTARFITESHQVKGMLEANMSLLKQSLEANGIKVEKTEVNVQVNTGGAFERDLGQHQRNEAAWTEQASDRPASLLRYGYELAETVEEHYALGLAEDGFDPLSTDDMFAAGRMNLVI
jgi:flagellar hook-length control protein FliK